MVSSIFTWITSPSLFVLSTACFHLDEYETACTAFEKGLVRISTPLPCDALNIFTNYAQAIAQAAGSSSQKKYQTWKEYSQLFFKKYELGDEVDAVDGDPAFTEGLA